METGWLGTIGNFGVLHITLSLEKIHVIGVVLSRVPNGKAVLNILELPFVDVSQVIYGYKNDQFL